MNNTQNAAPGLVQSVVNLSNKLSGKKPEPGIGRTIAHYFFSTNQLARSAVIGGVVAFFFSDYFFPPPEISKYGIYGKYVEDDDDEEEVEQSWWNTINNFFKSHSFLTTFVIFTGSAFLFI